MPRFLFRLNHCREHYRLGLLLQKLHKQDMISKGLLHKGFPWDVLISFSVKLWVKSSDLGCKGVSMDLGFFTYLLLKIVRKNLQMIVVFPQESERVNRLLK